MTKSFNPEDRKAADDNWLAYQRARDAGHNDYVELATKYDKFYRGEQWDPADEAKLKAQGRPALTINAVKSAVNTILGEYTTQRMDIMYKPRHSGHEDVAHALTKVAAQVQDNNHYSFVEGAVFADGLIQDRGWLDIRMDFSDSVGGEIRIKSEDPVDIMMDPSAKSYDPADWNEVIKTRWMTLDEIGLFYGRGKRKALEAMVYTEGARESDSVVWNQQTFGDPNSWATADTPERSIRRIRIIERQHKVMSSQEFFVDPNTGDLRAVPETWDDDKIEEFKEKYKLEISRKIWPRIRWTVSADAVVLHDAWSPYGSFTLVPFFPYFRRGRPTGVVRDLINPQEQLNKVESQQLHIVNTTANSGWVIESGSLANMNEAQLEKRGAETGIVIVYNRGRTPPAKIQPNQIPTGLDRLGQKALSNIREIAGVTSLLGVDPPEVSGVAITKKQSRGLVQMQVPFDNLAFTRYLVAKKILELIQQYYTETRVLRITNWNSPRQETEELVVNGVSPEGNLINDLTLGEYDVIVSNAPARDTFEETQFAEALQLREVGVNIPDHWVINASHLANKNEIAEEARQIAGLGEPTPEEMQLQQMQMELALRGAQAEIAETEAKVAKLLSEANLFEARANAEVASVGAEAQTTGAELRVRLMELQGSLAKHRETLKNKLELAQLHVRAKNNQLAFSEMNDQISEERKYLSERLNAGLKNRVTP